MYRGTLLLILPYVLPLVPHVATASPSLGALPLAPVAFTAAQHRVTMTVRKLLSILDAHQQARKNYGLPAQASFFDYLGESQLEKLADHRQRSALLTLIESPALIIPLRDLADAARLASEGSLDIPRYRPYLAKLLSYQIKPQEAIARAIQRQNHDRWARQRTRKIYHDDKRNFVEKVERLPVPGAYHSRLIKTYGVCIDSYRQAASRRQMRKISIETPMAGFGSAPRDDTKVTPFVSPGTSSPNHEAYRVLIDEIKAVVAEQKLDKWNQACLAKCIGDEMVAYSAARQHPFRAASLWWASMVADGADVLSSPYGVCTTYARITYDIARELGFADRIRVGHQGNHYFNQVKIENRWYHFHPLRKYGKDCSFFPYQ